MAPTATTGETRALGVEPARVPVLRLGAAPEGALLGDLLRAAARRWLDETLLERRNPDDHRPCTYGEFDREVDALATAFLASGLAPGDRVALFADNCHEWLLADQALARAGLVSVPRGTDTAPAELELIAAHSGASAIIAQDNALVETLPEETRRRPIWLLRHERGAVFQSLLGLVEDGTALLDRDGRALLDEARAQTHEDSACTIVYTSGTTGRPKGVVLTHANITSNIAGVNAVLDFFPGAVLLSILPSWHMFERILEYVVISNGCTLVYTNQRRLKHDLEHEAPHAVAFVPRIWESIAQGLEAKLRAASSTKRRVLEAFQEIGASLASGHGGTLTRWLHRTLSRVLLKPMWAALGGRLQLAVTGGGALPEDVDRLLLSLGVPLLNGYGLTETSPVISVRRIDGNRLRSVGPPLPETEVRIVGDGGDAAPGERGEIVVRGPQVMAGYYKDIELTRSVLDGDGWLRTGDLGWVDADGWIYVTGRSKDTIVLSGGENVEPEPIECRLRASPYIEQVMLVGQDEKVVGALVVPRREPLQEALGNVAAAGVRHVLRGEIDRLVTPGAGFRAVDRVGPFAVVDEPFSTESGTMTATLKLRRHVIAQQHATTIAALYRRG